MGEEKILVEATPSHGPIIVKGPTQKYFPAMRGEVVWIGDQQITCLERGPRSSSQEYCCDRILHLHLMTDVRLVDGPFPYCFQSPQPNDQPPFNPMVTVVPIGATFQFWASPSLLKGNPVRTPQGMWLIDAVPTNKIVSRDNVRRAISDRVKTCGWKTTYKLLEMTRLDNVRYMDQARLQEVMHRLEHKPKSPRIHSRNVSKYKDELYKKQDGVCLGCNLSFQLRNFEVDHIEPKSKGGTDDPSNLQLLCHACNVQKGNRSMAYLEKKLAEAD